MNIIVTRGAGLIGSAVILQLIDETDVYVVNVDKITYAGNFGSLTESADNNHCLFEQVDICDQQGVDRVSRKRLFNTYVSVCRSNRRLIAVQRQRASYRIS